MAANADTQTKTTTTTTATTDSIESEKSAVKLEYIDRLFTDVNIFVRIIQDFVAY